MQKDRTHRDSRSESSPHCLRLSLTDFSRPLLTSDDVRQIPDAGQHVRNAQLAGSAAQPTSAKPRRRAAAQGATRIAGLPAIVPDTVAGAATWRSPSP